MESPKIVDSIPYERPWAQRVHASHGKNDWRLAFAQQPTVAQLLHLNVETVYTLIAKRQPAGYEGRPPVAI